MIKLYRDSAEQLAMCLYYLLHHTGASMNEVQAGVSRSNGLTSKEILALRRSLRTPSATLESLKEQFDHLIKAISDDDLPNKDGDLIDLVVQTLQLPHVQNVLSGGRLSQLKKAILLPSEFAALAERVRARELSCGHCGSQFKDGEAVTLRHSGDRAAPGIVYCASCVKPDVIVCPGCKKLCAIQKMVGEGFVCPECSATPKKESKKSLKKAVADFTNRSGGAGTNIAQGGQRLTGIADTLPTQIPAGTLLTEAAPRGVQRDPQQVHTPPPHTFTAAWNEENAIRALGRTATTAAAGGGGDITYEQLAWPGAGANRDLERRAALTLEAVAGALNNPPPPIPMPIERMDLDDFDDDADFEDLLP